MKVLFCFSEEWKKIAVPVKMQFELLLNFSEKGETKFFFFKLEQGERNSKRSKRADQIPEPKN